MVRATLNQAKWCKHHDAWGMFFGRTGRRFAKVSYQRLVSFGNFSSILLPPTDKLGHDQEATDQAISQLHAWIARQLIDEGGGLKVLVKARSPGLEPPKLKLVLFCLNVGNEFAQLLGF